MTILIVLGIVAYFAVEAATIVKLNKQRRELEATHAQLMRIYEDLEKQFTYISSKDYIENQARIDLKLIKSDELLFVHAKKGDERSGN